MHAHKRKQMKVSKGSENEVMKTNLTYFLDFFRVFHCVEFYSMVVKIEKKAVVSRVLEVVAHEKALI